MLPFTVSTEGCPARLSSAHPNHRLPPQGDAVREPAGRGFGRAEDLVLFLLPSRWR